MSNELPKKFADHDVFVIPGITDVDKMRDEAYRRSQGDYYAGSVSTVIHHHRVSEKCYFDGPQIVDQKHETFGELK